MGKGSVYSIWEQSVPQESSRSSGIRSEGDKVEAERLSDTDRLASDERRIGLCSRGFEVACPLSRGTDGDKEIWNWGTGSGNAVLGEARAEVTLKTPILVSVANRDHRSQDGTWRLHGESLGGGRGHLSVMAGS